MTALLSRAALLGNNQFCKATFIEWLYKWGGYIKPRPKIKKRGGGFIESIRWRTTQHMVHFIDCYAVCRAVPPNEVITTPAPDASPEVLYKDVPTEVMEQIKDLPNQGYKENLPYPFRVWLDKKYGKGISIYQLTYYWFAVFISTPYQEKYGDCLPMDFSTIRYPEDLQTFLSLSYLGRVDYETRDTREQIDPLVIPLYEKH